MRCLRFAWAEGPLRVMSVASGSCRSAVHVRSGPESGPSSGAPHFAAVDAREGVTTLALDALTTVRRARARRLLQRQAEVDNLAGHSSR